MLDLDPELYAAYFYCKLCRCMCLVDMCNATSKTRPRDRVYELRKNWRGSKLSVIMISPILSLFKCQKCPEHLILILFDMGNERLVAISGVALVTDIRPGREEHY